MLTLWDVSSAKLLWWKKAPGNANVQRQGYFTADSEFVVASLSAAMFETLDVLDVRTGKTRHVIPWSILGIGPGPTTTFTRDMTFCTTATQLPRQPNFLDKILSNWWPKGSSTLRRVRVAEVATDRELAKLESDTLEDELLSEDGRTLVTKHNENGKYLLRVWDVPLRPPLRLVIGIPLGLGLLVLLFSRWRARRRDRTANASK